MAVTLKGQSAIYEGTSTDTKPTDADNNTIFKELDTGINYYYDGTDWNEIPKAGGGGFTPTESQLTAMNSGITAEDVEQITTNKSNISSIQQEQIVQNADIATLRLALDTKIYGIRIEIGRASCRERVCQYV